MQQYPAINKDQLKRLRLCLVASGLAKNSLDAMTKTASARKQREYALKYFEDAPEQTSIDDLAELYALDDEPLSQILELEKMTTKPPEEKKPRQTRGKGKKPVKRITSVALEPELYEDIEKIALKEERSVGSLIRIAIKYYLESIKGG